MPEESPLPSPPTSDPAPTTAPGRDPYGPDVGCMIILGLMILFLPTLMFGTALLAAAALMAAAVAWMLERFSPAVLRGKMARWKLWLIYFVILLVIAISGAIAIQRMADSSDYIRG